MQDLQSAHPAADSPAHVMVIDDDLHILEAFSKLLRLEGYVVTAFTCARDGLQALQNRPAQPPDCVLCDVVMPDMDGLALQAELSGFGDLSLVLMSGASGAPEAIHAFRAGAVDFLLKPVTSEYLLQAVASAVKLTRQRRHRSGRERQLAQQLAQLSEREVEVMRMVASGMTNLGMSIELGITERTIKYHRQRLIEKLGLSGTSDVVRLAQEFEQLRGVRALQRDTFRP